jgi:hypothetical protein
MVNLLGNRAAKCKRSGRRAYVGAVGERQEAACLGMGVCALAFNLYVVCSAWLSA